MSSKTSLLHDYTVVFRLIDSVEKRIVEAQADFTYAQTSSDFLNKVRQAAIRSKSRLTELYEDTDEQILDKEKETTRADMVALLCQAWLILHEFTKPIIDAHALSTPYPLVKLLNMQVRTAASGFDDAKVVVAVTPELNYFQHQNATLMTLLARLRKHIKRFPGFAANTAFISLPYSRSQVLFGNCLLYHELGHFIYQAKRFLYVAWPHFNNLVKNKYPTAADHVSSWFTGRLVSWVEELFSDLLACAMIGPAFSSAAAELSHFLDEAQGGEARALTFSYSHPADAFRFQQQLLMLKRRGWDLSRHWDNPRFDYIKRIAAHALDEYTSEPRGVYDSLISMFCNNANIATELVDKTLPHNAQPPLDFDRQAAGIKSLLSHGLVPSVLPLKEYAGDFEIVHPVSALNGGISFWLSEGVDELTNRFMPKQRERNVIDRRARLEERVELWVAKAIEDWFMTSKRRPQQLHVPKV